jgi:uncharacterized protein YwqG
MFEKFFGDKKTVRNSRDIPSLAIQNSVPAVHFWPAIEPQRTRIGGGLPIESALTSFQTESDKVPFLAALDMEELQRTMKIDWLPATGTIFFFYDHDKQEAWGFDPGDKRYFDVKYSDVRLSQVTRAQTSKNLGKLGGFPLKASLMQSVPSWERPVVEQLELTDEESEVWGEAVFNSFGYHPHHQVGGYPCAIQNDDMELECQLVTNGLNCGDSSGYHDPKAAALEAGKDDWRLLFQIDSDEDAGLMWGDVGTVYFWIKEQDARDLKFDRAWMILQCH